MPSWIGLLFTAILALHACNYLYFFVDDEAIPYVYAQNVLNGKGLSYNSFEGRVEGYSNFLHVCVATGILAVVRLFELNKLSVFVIGTLESLLCGVGLVWVTFLTLRKLPLIRPAGLLSGLAFLVLAGPLAVWSGSSLETATFAFLMACLIYLTVSHARGQPLTWATMACATAALLTRIDGFIYVGAVLGPALVFGDPPRRKELWMWVVMPSAAIFGAYQVWRMTYFHELLSMPVYTKVLYKLQLNSHVLTKPPEQNYARAFFGMYGAVPIGALCTAWLLWHRSPVVLACLTSAGALVAYLTIVGDWMFGFRFFVPVLPLLALLIASSISAIAARARLVGWLVAALCVSWFGNVAYAFDRDYARIEKHESWLTHPSLDPNLHFSRYYSLYEESRKYMPPGERIAYNQAGFLSFMLDLDNIDDLGISSKFFAKLPTTDVFFTEVGRYAPLTNKPVFTAGEAYLLYRDPTFIVAPEDLLRKANMNQIPEEILGGFYRQVFRDASRQNVVYGRTERSVHEFKAQPRRFLENLAHVSHLTSSVVNGVPVPQKDFVRVFPWLRLDSARLTVGGTYRVDLEFSDRDEAIYEVHIDHLDANKPLRFVLTLRSRAGTVTYQRVLELQARQSRGFHEYLPEPIEASRLRIEIAGTPSDPARIQIGDLRVQGQTTVLREYIHETLRFPPS